MVSQLLKPSDALRALLDNCTAAADRRAIKSELATRERARAMHEADDDYWPSRKLPAVLKPGADLASAFVHCAASAAGGDSWVNADSAEAGMLAILAAAALPENAPGFVAALRMLVWATTHGAVDAATWDGAGALRFEREAATLLA